MASTLRFSRPTWAASSAVLIIGVAGLALILPMLASASLLPDLWNRGWLLFGSSAAGRTVVLSVGVSVGCVVAGFWLSIRLHAVAPRSILGRLLPILMLPALAGTTATSFLLKMTLVANPGILRVVADRPQWGTLTIYGASLAWQYLPLCIYMFWLRNLAVAPSVRTFAQSSSLTFAEAIRDILWPSARNLAIVLALLISLSAGQDHAIGYHLLRASTGSDTAMISHALLELYQLLQAPAPKAAADVILANSLLLAPLLLAMSGLSVALTLASQHMLIRAAPRVPRRTHGLANTRPALTGWLAVLIVLTPILWSLVSVPPQLHRDITPMMGAAAFTVIGSVGAFALAVLLGAALRLLLPRSLETLNGRALWVVIALVALKSIPALAIALMLYALLWPALSFGTPILFGVWLVAHAFVHLPFLALFVLWIHHRLTAREIEYQTLAGASTLELLRHSFLASFGLDYVLVAIFAWSFVWNESVINRLLSDRMPSLSASLAPLIGTRPDYHTGMLVVLLSLLVVTAAIPLWSFITSRLDPEGRRTA